MKQFKPRFVIEIGSANGLGSTAAILPSMPETSVFFGLESDPERFFEAVENVKKYKQDIHLYNSSSVPVDEFMDNTEIVEFLVMHPEMNLSKYSLETILGWREENVESLAKNKTHQDGIAKIMDRIAVSGDFDFDDMMESSVCVLIDGSAFSGKSEMEHLYNAAIFILDDTNDIKNYENYIELKYNPAYCVWKENQQYRNGYAIFVKKELIK
jgi:hypothetical protein